MPKCFLLGSDQGCLLAMSSLADSSLLCILLPNTFMAGMPSAITSFLTPPAQMHPQTITEPPLPYTLGHT
ncbi:hypothetical protein PHYBLDRAFT_142348 [Phycomyces blakesleeanus NRRL 1555(-)]|uniref:Uncharacterized protein n=1 Tax=Phycomyces blakesleeanus (strain ATCC 8743b / DSM 1359 / FGSC 10004 / NBRC 33097 / NRRL 1555) TaxID=763407 RepID=A0A162UPJ4_PHYB8|nr:hypothetical protein PHYBLDRAFT_142348 [Phycomyces blakesleeanus NRRL 1555(-)]OAD76843.1 hypothetical protein PHYBLDRAFT_142348 [Phycomyces blakesleeanus NRRL 1555(-)]|eukprot:XP_018294883.1 hypothetical protein PHYBLDRAFT_142348 [Phycomyces blakesleeanus NRRL 1555(-)]